MFGVGTNFYSVVFTGGAIIFMILVAAYLVNLWVRFGREYVAADKEAKPTPNLIPPVVKTVAVIVASVVALTWGWNLMMAHTTTTSTYQSPAEKAEQKKVRETVFSSPEELEKVRAAQKKKQEAKPHDEAAQSFEDQMKKEAEKIKQRNK